MKPQQLNPETSNWRLGE